MTSAASSSKRIIIGTISRDASADWLPRKEEVFFSEIVPEGVHSWCALGEDRAGVYENFLGAGRVQITTLGLCGVPEGCPTACYSDWSYRELQGATGHYRSYRNLQQLP